MNELQLLLRSIPQVDEILQHEGLIFLCREMPRALVKEEIRKISQSIREDMLAGKRTVPASAGEIVNAVLKNVKTMADPSGLTPVINATGVIIHTNLGRSILSDRALKAMLSAAAGYSDLEYDIEKGKRGLRHTHIEQIIKDITGAEAAMVVNNNAAATMLVLSALSSGKETVVSRGELIEIGGSFRIPEIMEQSNAILKEVGTTNKTRISDYTGAFDPEKTAAYMKVHTSNYKIMGFTEDVPLEQMVQAGHERNIPVIYDMGSGLFADLSRYGIDEPTVPKMLSTGVDVIMFSGDKLLGGPQAGIIIGKKKYIDMMKGHPLSRAIRVDKMTIAALSATLYEYYDPANALKTIPVLHMITASKEELRLCAERLAELLKERIPGGTFLVEACRDQVGGGSAPMVYLEGYIVTVSIPGLSADLLEEKLRRGPYHVICRILHDNVGIDVRTLSKKDRENVVLAFSDIIFRDRLMA